MLPESLKIVDASGGPVTTDGGVTCDYVSLKNVQRAWIIASFTQAAGHATGIDPIQATAVAGTSAKPFVNTLPIWANEDTATSDTLTRATDAIDLQRRERHQEEGRYYPGGPGKDGRGRGLRRFGLHCGRQLASHKLCERRLHFANALRKRDASERDHGLNKRRAALLQFRRPPGNRASSPGSRFFAPCRLISRRARGGSVVESPFVFFIGGPSCFVPPVEKTRLRFA